MQKKSKCFIHPSADVSNDVVVGNNTKIWHNAQIREESKIGEGCIVGKGAYLDKNTTIGNRVKIQNYASLYHKTIVEDGVFIGPYVCLTNDRLPRSVNPDDTLKSESDWHVGNTVIHKGASVGTGTIILPDIEIGEYAMIGAGSVVTRNVPAYALVFGVPARVRGFVCKCGNILTKNKSKPKVLKCKQCLKLFP